MVSQIIAKKMIAKGKGGAIVNMSSQVFYLFIYLCIVLFYFYFYFYFHHLILFYFILYPGCYLITNFL